MAPDQTRNFLVQLDSTFHTRVNILLVAESVFLAALSQVWASKELGIIIFICVLAVAMTWLLWGPLRALADRTGVIAGKLTESDPIYRAYITSGSEKLGQINRLANWVPGLFAIAWVVIAVLALVRHFDGLPFLTQAPGA